MTDVVSVCLMIAAIAVFFGPLLLIGFAALADYLGGSIGERILGVAVGALMAKFALGGVVNIALGIALSGMAAWMARQSDIAGHMPIAGLLLIGGFWRAWRGASVLRDYRDVRLEDTK